MANSYVLYNGDGSTQNFTVSFGYIDQDHVSIEVGGSTVPSTWVNDTTIRATSAPAVGTGNVKVKRTTPKAPLVTFTDGAGLTATDLNFQATQARYVAEEQEDAYLEGGLTDLSVATGSLQDGAVTAGKLGDGAVTEGKLGLASVTLAKMADLTTRKVIGRLTGSTGVPEAVSPDDLKVIADGATTERDLSSRFSDTINPLDHGVVGDGVTDDTAAIQAILDALEGLERKLIFPMRRYVISQITIHGLGLEIDFNNAIFIGNASTARNSMVQIKCGLSHIQNLKVTAGQNQNYTCGVHWYTNDLNVHFPSRNRIDGLFVTEALIGLVIGALPAQVDPIPAQGTVQADGTATDAPISECYISGLKITDCIRGVYMRQPNGKMQFVAPDITAEYLAWATPPSTALCCALTVNNDGSELTVLGGDVEGIQSPDGTIFQCTAGQLLMEGVCLEGITQGYIAGTGMVRMSHIQNWGLNSTTKVMMEVDDGATGILQISDSRLFMVDAFAAGTVSWLKTTSSLNGSFSPAPSFRVECKGVEFYNAPFAWPTPIVDGCDVSFVNCSRSVYSGTTRSSLRKLHDLDELLAPVADVTFDQVTDYASATSLTVAGWTSAVGGAGSTWGKYTTSLPTIEAEAPNAACRLTTTGATMTITSEAFPIPKGKDILLRGWMKSGTTANAILARFQWFKFDGSTAASTADTTLISGQEVAQAGSTWRPFILKGQPPADAAKAKVFFYAEAGADLQVLNLSVK